MNEQQRRMKVIIDHFKKYVATYDEHASVDYSIHDETFINDMIYGIGICIDNEFEFADGYDKFKKILIEFLQTNILDYHEPIRQCDDYEDWYINAGNSDAKCFDEDILKRNTEVCKDCIYNTMMKEI